MGEVIVFKAEKDGTHLRTPPEGSAKIVLFTGVWHEPDADLEAVTRREDSDRGNHPRPAHLRRRDVRSSRDLCQHETNVEGSLYLL